MKKCRATAAVGSDEIGDTDRQPAVRLRRLRFDPRTLEQEQPV